MQGTLKQLGERFAFFDTPDGDVFVLRHDLPDDAANGDRYEFDTRPGGDGRRPMAIGLRFLSRGQPVQNTARQGRDRPDRNRDQQQKKIEVLIKPDEEGEVRTFPEGDFRSVPTVFSIKRGNTPLVGLTVQFYVDSNPVDQTFTTDGSGHIYFPALLDPNAKHANIVAVVKDGDAEVGVYSQTWKAKKEEKTQPKPVNLQVLPEGQIDSSSGQYNLTVVANKDDKPTAAKVEFTSTEEVTLTNRVTKATLATKVKQCILDIDANGRLVLEVDYPGFECRVSFRDINSNEGHERTLAFI